MNRDTEGRRSYVGVVIFFSSATHLLLDGGLYFLLGRFASPAEVARKSSSPLLPPAEFLKEK